MARANNRPFEPDRDAERYEADCQRYGALPLPTHMREGPKDEAGKPLDPARRWIPVYPDNTFPRPTLNESV